MDNNALFATEVKVACTPYHYCLTFQWALPPKDSETPPEVIKEATVFLSQLHFDKVLDILNRVKDQNQPLVEAERAKPVSVE